MRKHFKLVRHQEQFLLMESAHRFARKSNHPHSEADFRQCLRFSHSFMDNDEDADDFCLDLMYGKMQEEDSWQDTISNLWESVAFFFFIVLSGFFYYYILFVMKSPGLEED